ncbi:unnamed protein product, partial [Prorocentrum cordatum]
VLHLHLAHCTIGATGSKALAESLASLLGLRLLSLSDSGVGGAGAEALAGALPSMPAQRKLWLDESSMGDAGAAMPGLRDVRLESSRIDGGAEAALRASWES